jgi:16S rRNA (cytosine967-C5)-methyltransferase
VTSPPASRITPARRAAYAAIRRTFEEGAYTDRALAAEAEGLDPRERGLAKRLAFGTVQRRLTLDHVVERLARRSAADLDPPVLAALRLGVYELAFSDSAGHAAVDQAVELAKAAGAGGASGLVNAVLRRASREARDLVAALPDATPEQAAIRHSHPEWVARTWWAALGPDDARALMAADNEPGETAVRVNTLRADPREVAEQLHARPADSAEGGRTPGDGGTPGNEGTPMAGAPHLPEGLLLTGAVDLASTDLFANGAITPQSRASMAIARILDPQPGERILDLCSAPGTKATHIAALTSNQAQVGAVEANPARAGELERNAQRLGAQIDVVVGDARDDHGTGYDRVLVDPPCTGLGTLRSRPDLRWRATEKSAKELATLQREILASAARSVRPGGTVVYSVCTINPQEGEGVADANQDLIPDDLQTDHPLWKHPRVANHLLPMPHRNATDGFFIARLRRPA